MNGVIVVNKPVGISCNSVVNIVKKITNSKKAGHLGTLDVLGEGVLPVTLGKSTKLFDIFLSKTKTYRAVFCFGFETDTLDCEGKVINLKNYFPTKLEIENALKFFIGKYNQLPPAYSSKKVNGKNAYEFARKGENVVLKEKEVEIISFKISKEILDCEKEILLNRFLKFHDLENDENRQAVECFKNTLYEFEITCGAGTYIRSLCRDVANKLSTCGTMLSITRTKCGNFDYSESYTLEDIKNGNYKVIPPYDVVDLEKISIEKEQLKDLLNGKNVFLTKFDVGEFNLFCNDVYIGICKINSDGCLKIKTFLMEE